MPPSNPNAGYCSECDESCPTSHINNSCEICGTKIINRPASLQAASQLRLQTQADQQLHSLLQSSVSGAGVVNGLNSNEAARTVSVVQAQEIVAALAAGVIQLPGLDLNSNINGFAGGDMWETPPNEAMNPNVQKPKSHPTSVECLAKIPRIVVDERSSILHEGSLRITSSADSTNNKVIDAVISEFSARPPYNIQNASLVLADPIFGSSSSLANNEIMEGNIVIFKRGGGITFAAKAAKAQKAGAVGVVIVQSEGVWPYIMKDSKNESKTHNLTTPIIMIKRSDGQSLISQIQTSTSVGETTRCHLNAKLTSEHDGCIICRDNFDVNCTIIRMPFCSHCFHEECALMWLKSNNTCPVCRRELPTDDEEYEIERRRERRTHGGVSAGGEGREGNNDWETLLFG